MAKGRVTPSRTPPSLANESGLAPSSWELPSSQGPKCTPHPPPRPPHNHTLISGPTVFQRLPSVSGSLCKARTTDKTTQEQVPREGHAIEASHGDCVPARGTG